MKKIIGSFLLCIAIAVSVFAQSASPARETVTGAVIGGVAGAVIGNNSKGGNTEKGALIGLVTGGLIGNAVGQTRVISQQQRELDRLRGRPFGSNHYDGALPIRTPHGDAIAIINSQIVDAQAEATVANARLERLEREYLEARATAQNASRRVRDLEEARGHLANAGLR